VSTETDFQVRVAAVWGMFVGMGLFIVVGWWALLVPVVSVLLGVLLHER
jgi:hypothetical protein